MIPFNKPPVTGREMVHIEKVMQNHKLSGDGEYGKACQSWFESRLGCPKVLLTPSCTAALEIAAMLIDIKPGDEVIMPSYTFVSTANAFVLRGAKIIFVDVRPDTMNIDEAKIEAAITSKTKAIVPVHYAGVGCEMDAIMELANRYNLFVIEDAAQGMMSTYNGRPLGTIGDIGAYSFHETKNYSCGEGGALLINNEKFKLKAEIIREKGTNRSQFFRGQVDKYTWMDVGSSYLPSELQAGYLMGQLESVDDINNQRLEAWGIYYRELKPLQNTGLLDLPSVPKHCEHNAHMFYVKVRDVNQRGELINHLANLEIMSVFHYVPLHSSPAGLRLGELCGEDQYTTSESERLLRLPMFYGLTAGEVKLVTSSIQSFFK